MSSAQGPTSCVPRGDLNFRCERNTVQGNLSDKGEALRIGGDWNLKPKQNSKCNPRFLARPKIRSCAWNRKHKSAKRFCWHTCTAPPKPRKQKCKQIKERRKADKGLSESGWRKVLQSLILWSASSSDFSNMEKCYFDLFCLSPNKNITLFIKNGWKTEPECQEVVWLLIFSFQQLHINHQD